MNYARALRTIRSARGMTQKQLAADTGLNRSYISLLESGERKPSADTLELVCEKLQIPPYLLVLLASDEEELRGISSSEAQTLGQHLLSILMHPFEGADASA